MKQRTQDNFFFLWLGLFVVLTLVVGGIQLRDATECGNKGGLYLTGKGIWPVCVKAETL